MRNDSKSNYFDRPFEQNPLVLKDCWGYVNEQIKGTFPEADDTMPLIQEYAREKGYVRSDGSDKEKGREFSLSEMHHLALRAAIEQAFNELDHE